MNKEQQRNKIREELKAKGENVSTSGNMPVLIKRIVNGRVVFLTPKQNKRLNKRKKKPPKIFFGYNTGK